MIHIEERHWEIVEAILQKYPYTFYAFGSRTKGTQKKFSDLDLCVKEKIPLRILGQITENFEESRLPFKVDVIDWGRITPEFQDIIKNDLTPLQNLRKNAKTHH